MSENPASSPGAPLGEDQAIMVAQALAEIGFCEAILGKSGLSVLGQTLNNVTGLEAWSHYPPGDIYDPDSGAQWFYHCHPAQEGSAEHGHFHCFIRPEGPQGPIHHLIAVGVDTQGQLLRLFTVNQWVVGDDWLAAEETLSLLDRFDVQMPQPCYLVNRWLSAILRAYTPQIQKLIRQRDLCLQAHSFGADDQIEARADRALEVTSEWIIPKK